MSSPEDRQAARAMPWAYVNCRTGHEAKLASLLTQRGRETYFPQVTQWRRPRFKRKPIPVQVAAMPGYMFIRYDTIGDPEELYAMENFHYFLRDPEGALHLLPDGDIEWIRENIERAEKPTAPPLRLFGLWERVKVSGGPFGGMCGVVTGVCKREVWVGGRDFTYPVLFPVLLLEKNTL